MRDGVAETVRPNVLSTLNSMFDELPRTRVGALGKEAPAFRTCGVAGFYVALVVLCGAGLMTGRSLPVLAIIMVVSGLSFFAYTYWRRWITGVERLVLLEHVWFALAVNAGVLWLMHQPVLPYLDVISVALCPFLAAGRVGCTLVGCCHGNPSAIGIRYTEASATDGFERHLVGVRLFPVPAIEAIGLLSIGLAGLLALPFAESGKVFAWYLLSYSVMRFALEGLRGDVRPHWIGLSQARWMSIIEFVVAIQLSSSARLPIQLAVDGALFAALVAALFYRQCHDERMLHLAASHIGELRSALESEIATQSGLAVDPPSMFVSSLQTTLAVSAADGDRNVIRSAHVSVALAPVVRDLRLLVDLVVEAFPNIVVQHAELTRGHLLHVRVPIAARRDEAIPTNRRGRANALYGMLVRRAQHEREAITADTPAVDAPHRVVRVLPSDEPPLDSHAGGENGNGHARQRYFASAGNRTL